MATLFLPVKLGPSRSLLRCLLTVLFLLVAVPRGTGAESAGGDDAADEVDPGVALRLLNREIFVFRAPLGAYQPAQRAAAAAALIEEARGQNGTERVALLRTGTNVEVRVHGRTVFHISPQDVFEIRGETFEQLIEETQRRLDQVLVEMDELRDRQGLALAAAKAVGLTAIYGAFVWALARNRRWLGQRLIRLTADKADQIKSNTLRLLGLQNAVPLLRGTVTTIFWGLVVLVSYVWLEHVLLLFPHTRPLGEQLDSRFFKLLAGFGESLVRALPNLAIVFCVLLAARFASSAVRRFFATVARGQFRSRIVDPATAPITQRLFIMLIWVTAIIVAFPYIPGSQTPAFRGISVLAGLMISLGSASVVGHLVGGLILVYNRTCRPGDYIRVGQHEGTLRSFGFFSSRMVTVKNEEVVIPNSQLSGDALINYSRLNDEAGVVLPVRISIGYNTPWRQVRDMMIEAARRTEGVRREPAPEVLQTALSDFYVEYQLNAVALDPARRVPVQSDLHANILDVFNENAVQIMSPHYRADPPQPVLAPVPRRTSPAV